MIGFVYGDVSREGFVFIGKYLSVDLYFFKVQLRLISTKYQVFCGNTMCH